MLMRVARQLIPIVGLCAVLTGGSSAFGQGRQDQLNFNSQTPLPLDTLIRYISERMEMKFIYSADIGRRQVNLRTPAGSPPTNLFPLFSSALRTANLAIVDAEVAGWKRIAL